MSKILCDGLDRLGKSTLIKGLINKLGYHDIIHYSKPLKLEVYNNDLKQYQEDSFRNLFKLINALNVNLIADRSHIGEAVYANLYRGYDGNYVFDLENEYYIDLDDDALLILLTQDMASAKHFVDDGESLGPIEAREKEQDFFIQAFNKSIIENKHIVCVTDTSTGNFRPAQDILNEVLGYISKQHSEEIVL